MNIIGTCSIESCIVFVFVCAVLCYVCVILVLCLCCACVAFVLCLCYTFVYIDFLS